jgi:hypothetical protein
VKRVAFAMGTVLLLASLAGCRHVAPYERAKLAHPTMGTASVAGVAEEHMYAVHEGATGGGAAAESGCGCN